MYCQKCEVQYAVIPGEGECVYWHEMTYCPMCGEKIDPEIDVLPRIELPPAPGKIDPARYDEANTDE